MTMFYGMSAAAASGEKIYATLPDYPVKINGHVLNNRMEKYPIINYKGITYIPLTANLSWALGLSVRWDSLEWLKINRAMKKISLMQIDNTGELQNELSPYEVMLPS